MSKALKDCPFCKGRAKRQSHVYSGDLISIDFSLLRGVYEEKRYYVVKCSQCGISQPKRKYATREESDAAWNNRA